MKIELSKKQRNMLIHILEDYKTKINKSEIINIKDYIFESVEQPAMTMVFGSFQTDNFSLETLDKTTSNIFGKLPEVSCEINIGGSE